MSMLLPRRDIIVMVNWAWNTKLLTCCCSMDIYSQAGPECTKLKNVYERCESVFSKRQYNQSIDHRGRDQAWSAFHRHLNVTGPRNRDGAHCAGQELRGLSVAKKSGIALWTGPAVWWIVWLGCRAIAKNLLYFMLNPNTETVNICCWVFVLGWPWAADGTLKLKIQQLTLAVLCNFISKYRI